MRPDMVTIGGLEVSRFIIGGNPFSGFSHQSPQVDDAQRHFFTTARIKETLREAESLGINTHNARADHHVMRVLMEYWDEGGTIQWFAQTCPELGSPQRGAANGVRGGASAVYVHGGVMDHLLAQGRLGEAADTVKAIHDAGLPAGVAGHNPRVFEWAEEHLDVDFYMCCHYNPTRRDEDPEHPHGAREKFDDQDRQRMVRTIAHLARPAIHYKVLAAGRNDPAQAFQFVARHLRENDAVCVGIYQAEKPHMLREDVDLLMQALERERAATT
ncbi:MAG: hypothetical protein ACLF0G_13290 [Candidatus Brocadiia bacterium]